MKCPPSLLDVGSAVICCLNVLSIRFPAQSSRLGIAHARSLLVPLGVRATKNDFLLLLHEDAAGAEKSGNAILNEVLLDVVLGLDGTGFHLEEVLKVSLGDAIFVTELLSGLGHDKEVRSEAVESAPD